MNVCFVYKEDYPWDVRVEKIVKTLAERGHSVTLVANNTARRARHERLDAITIRRLQALPGIFGRLNDAVSLPVFFNPLWLFAIFRTLRRTGAPVVIVRDLPLMPAALLIGRILGRRIVFDMAECYPAMYASALRFSDQKAGNYMLKNPHFAALLERISVRYADHVLVMIEESRDRLLQLGFDAAKITIVSNTPRTTAAATPRTHLRKDVLKIIYVGFVTRLRGIDNALHGLAAYAAADVPRPSVVLHVVGTGAALAECRALADRLGLGPLVQFHGWLEHDFVKELYAESDIGVLPYHVCSHWNHTIPNKLFDYMASGIPVLCTNVRPIQRIVDEVGCGLVCADNDAASFAECLLRLTDSDVRADMGRRGFEAIRARYNWETDSMRLTDVVERLAPRRPEDALG
ncbi:MAG: glycosyltransferase [Luteitalea sp.]|nr:glycosyltransferase [Luteitalea sp.]